jgi:hypothetical protein
MIIWTESGVNVSSGGVPWGLLQLSPSQHFTQGTISNSHRAFLMTLTMDNPSRKEPHNSSWKEGEPLLDILLLPVLPATSLLKEPGPAMRGSASY